MQIVHQEFTRLHAPTRYYRSGAIVAHPDAPERAEVCAAALRDAGFELTVADDSGSGPRAAVHTSEYLAFLQRAHACWIEAGLAAQDLVPNAHPVRVSARLPEGIRGQVGYFMVDTSCPIGAQSWRAACRSADVAVHATRLVLSGGGPALGVCRPPGHHSSADTGGGFCFLNNVAIAAQVARDAGRRRVAILDVDVHHGNGTQSIFYGRDDVLTVSLHCDPSDFYPFYTGYDPERGQGLGEGFNLNLPLPRGTTDATYLSALEQALSKVSEFSPELLLVALGLDGHEADPCQGFALTTPGFSRIAAEIGSLGLPTVLVQEGGYDLEHLGANLVAFLSGLT